MTALADIAEMEWALFTIFEGTADGPVVVRAWIMRGQAEPDRPVPLPWTWRFGSVSAARLAIKGAKPSAAWLPRDPSDVPEVVESWF